MGIRALAGALFAAAVAAPAMAQGVPPAKRFVGPPVELAGSEPAAPRPPIGGPTIQAPGAVPPQRVVTPPSSESAAEQTGKYAGAVGAAGTLTQQGASQLGRMTDTLAGAELASDLHGKGASMGKAAAVVNLGANVKVAAEKCNDPAVNKAECLQAVLGMGASEASVIEILPGGATSWAGAGATGLSVAADATGAYNNCYAKDEATWLDCVQSLADTGVSLGSNLPGGGKVISATYTVAKVIAPALVDQAGQKVLGKSPGEWLYDRFAAADRDAEIAAKTSSPEALEGIRARRRAAYAAAARELVSKQSEANEQRARLAAEQQAAANQAYVNAQQAAQMQALTNGLTSMIQASAAPPPAPMSSSSASDGSSDRELARSPGSSSSSGSSSGGCRLTAADQAAGRVCTAN